MTLRIKSATTIRGFTAVNGNAPVVSQNFLTDQTKPSWMDTSGMTDVNSINRTMYDSTGKLTYAPNNLLTFSNTFTNAAWTKQSVTIVSGATDYLGGTSAFTMTDNNVSDEHRIYYSGLPTSPTRMLSIIAKAGTASFIGLSAPGNTGYFAVFNLSNGTVALNGTIGGVSSISPIGAAGWYLISVTCPPSGAGPYFIVNMGTTAAQATTGTAYVGTGSTIFISNAVESFVTYETAPRSADQVITTSAIYYGPRFDNPNGVPQGLLIEEQRINITPYSNSLSNVYFLSGNLTRTATGGTGPDGVTNSMWLFTEDATAGVTHTFFDQNSVPVTPGTTFTRSFYIAQGTRQYIQATVGAFANGFGVVIDTTSMTIVATGAAGGSTYTSSSITSVGNGIYRVSITGVINTSTMYAAFCALDSAAYVSTVPANAVGGKTWKLYGLQTEAGAFATSYIPTQASSVTRAADIVKLSGVALTTIQGSSVTLVSEYTGPATPVSGSRLVGTTGATPMQNFGGTLNWFDGSGNANFPGATISAGVSGRGAIGWTSSKSVSYVANGGTVGTASTIFNSSSFSATYFGSTSGTVSFWNGYMRAISIYNTRLSDAALQAKSVVGSAL